MAKLSYGVLEEGREYLRAKDLEGYMAWVDRTRVMINKDVLRTTMQRCLMAGDVEKAIKMSDAGFANADPDLERVAYRMKLGCSLILLLFMGLGLLGGVVYLFRAIFG